MNIEAGTDDITKTSNDSMNSRGHHHSEKLELQQETDNPVTIAREHSESLHLPVEEENRVFRARKTHQQQSLPGEEQTRPGIVRFPPQETLSDEESVGSSDSLSGDPIPNDYDNVASPMNDELHVVPEAELVDFTPMELESQLAELNNVINERSTNTALSKCLTLSKMIFDFMKPLLLLLVVILVMIIIILLRAYLQLK